MKASLTTSDAFGCCPMVGTFMPSDVRRDSALLAGAV